MVASLLLTGCQTLDKEWVEPSQDEEEEVVPFIKPTGREDVFLQLSPTHRTVLDWLSNLPDRVLEEVVVDLLAKVEKQLLEDKDKKLIMTLINIEHMKINDFFFGVHSLLSLVQGFELQSLKFSKRLMFCLWEYGEITSSKLMVDTLCSSLPGLSSITSLNIPHIATDKLVYTLSRHLTCLISLDLSSSRVTDRGVRYLAGGKQTEFRHINSLKDIPTVEETIEEPNHDGCSKLEHIKLQSCEWVTEMGLRFLLEHLACLKRVKYHQRSSLLEIMIKWASNMTEEKRESTVLNLTEVEHGFPYGLSPLSENMNKLSMLIPNLTTITMVTEDKVVDLLVMFPHLTSITVELEDCLGVGFLHLLEHHGSQLLEISVSCNSDPEASLSLDQVDGPGGQQGQLFNLAVVCVGQLARNVRKLSVSGCGLVSSEAVRKMKMEDKIGNSSWMRRQADCWFKYLESLIMMSYEDSLPAMSIHSVLLKSVLMAAKKLTVLNLEGNFGSIFSDSFFSDIVKSNHLSSLRILDICVNDQQGEVGRIPLTVSTVHLLLAKCDNLKELRISDWNVTSHQVAEVRRIVKKNNWDLMVTRRVGVEDD